MSPSKSLFCFILFALSIVNAAPPQSGTARMPLSRVPVLKPPTFLYKNELGKRDDIVFVQKELGYYCTYLVTSSTSTFRLIVDTGTAHGWVGVQQHNPYVPGPASVATGIPVETSYGGDAVFVKGEIYNDTIGLGALIVDHQGLGVPTEAHGFPEGIDGLLALGPSRRIGSDGRLIPTVVDNLYNQGTISSPLLGVYFVPENVATSGLLSFGHIRESVLTSDVKYVPVTRTYPASYKWGVDASMMYGDNTPILAFGSGLLDTGSPKITIASAAFSTYKSVTGGVFHPSGKLMITQAQYNNLQTLSILIGDQSYDLSPNAQIYARSSPNSRIFLVIERRRPSRSAFILGVPFFQRYYVVLNSGNNEIGFASHIYTDSITN